jgi:hypothetical protein
MSDRARRARYYAQCGQDGLKRIDGNPWAQENLNLGEFQTCRLASPGDTVGRGEARRALAQHHATRASAEIQALRLAAPAPPLRCTLCGREELQVRFTCRANVSRCRRPVRRPKRIRQWPSILHFHAFRAPPLLWPAALADCLTLAYYVLGVGRPLATCGWKTSARTGCCERAVVGARRKDAARGPGTCGP